MTDYKEVSHELQRLIDIAEGSHPHPIAASSIVYELNRLNDLWKSYLQSPVSKVDEPEYDPAYVGLARVLADAFNQAAGGKGKDRHVKEEGQAFEDQPICTLQRLYGRGYAFGQVGKKMEESSRLPYEQARAELLGGIVYLAAAVIDLEKDHGDEQANPTP